MYVIKLYFKDQILYHSYDGEPDELSEAVKFNKEDAIKVSKLVEDDLRANSYYNDTFIKAEIIPFSF